MHRAEEEEPLRRQLAATYRTILAPGRLRAVVALTVVGSRMDSSLGGLPERALRGHLGITTLIARELRAAHSSRIRPANDRDASRNDENHRAQNPQVRGRVRSSSQVVKPAPRTLSRWRHGFEPRWDYAGQSRCGTWDAAQDSADSPPEVRETGPSIASATSRAASFPSGQAVPHTGRKTCPRTGPPRSPKGRIHGDDRRRFP